MVVFDLLEDFDCGGVGECGFVASDFIAPDFIAYDIIADLFADDGAGILLGDLNDFGVDGVFGGVGHGWF